VTPEAASPLLEVESLDRYYGSAVGCRRISFRLWPGEILGIVGESGSGKTTVLRCVSGRMAPTDGRVRYLSRDVGWIDLYNTPLSVKRRVMRTEMGFVHQNAREGLRMKISAGGNIGERLLANGVRHYGRIRRRALEWLERVEIDTRRVDDTPGTFSGGMQQRLQIARNLVTQPRLLFMDEPTSGLDVSVQAKLMDILRRLVVELALSMVIVTHDLAVARLLAHRLCVMRLGEVVEAGLTDQVLDDPHHPYTQLLVSSILTP
jgi:putative phosphonate transport system ATP-binding protein